MNKRQQKKQLDVAKEVLLDQAKETDEFVESVLQSYDEAAERLKGDIHKILVKFADTNELTISQASELLSSKEHSIWKKGIEKYLQDIENYPDSKMLIELNTLSAKSRISQKELLLAEIDKEMSSLVVRTNKEIEKHLTHTLVENYYRGHYAVQKTFGLGFKVSSINHSLVKQIIEYPWSTKKFSKTIWDNTDKLAEMLRKELSSGLVDGSSLKRIVKRIDDVMGKGKKVTERAVRSESKYFTQQAELLSYQKMGIEKYMYKGAGCLKCAAINGRTFDVVEAIVQVNCPPMHPFCKCRIVAVTELSLFDVQRNVVPLDQNIKFDQWKEKFVKNGNKAK